MEFDWDDIGYGNDDDDVVNTVSGDGTDESSDDKFIDDPDGFEGEAEAPEFLETYYDTQRTRKEYDDTDFSVELERVMNEPPFNMKDRERTVLHDKMKDIDTDNLNPACIVAAFYFIKHDRKPRALTASSRFVTGLGKGVGGKDVMMSKTDIIRYMKLIEHLF